MEVQKILKKPWKGSLLNLSTPVVDADHEAANLIRGYGLCGSLYPRVGDELFTALLSTLVFGHTGCKCNIVDAFEIVRRCQWRVEDACRPMERDAAGIVYRQPFRAR